MPDNFERMLELVGEAFDTRNDPDQISVTPEEQELLALLHKDTLSELANEDGPIVWILLVPTTRSTMDRFLANTITEKQLLHETVAGEKYDALYLCSATVLPEFRGKGLAKKLCLEAITNIRQEHPISTLFYWPFSAEGKGLAMSLSLEIGLPLHEKIH
jgi:ribosomal protein S18 acetylase RimI-like enzyme